MKGRKMQTLTTPSDVNVAIRRMKEVGRDDLADELLPATDPAWDPITRAEHCIPILKEAGMSALVVKRTLRAHMSPTTYELWQDDLDYVEIQPTQIIPARATAGRPRRKSGETWSTNLAAELGMSEADLWVELRLALGFTKSELARVVGVERTAIYRWERNQSYPNPADHAALLAVLEGGIADLKKEWLASSQPA